MTINRREFLKGAAAAWTMAAVPWLGARAAAAARPNILYIMSDDHSQRAISAYGSVVNKTPNIDRIAREGAILRRNTCCNSICGPSRATVLTGKHSHLNGYTCNIGAFEGSQMTFPKILQKAGYKTAIVGKWHLVSEPQGFDYWDILPGQGDYYNPDFISAAGKRRVPGYVTDLTTDLAMDWMKQQAKAGQPFLMMCHYKAPHRNWLPDAKHLPMFKGEKIPEPDTLFDDFSGRTSSIRANEMEIGRHMIPPSDLKLQPEGAEWKGDGFARMTPEQFATFKAAYEDENREFFKNPPQGKDLTRWNYQRYMKDYLRCIAAVDDNVGRILAFLDEAGLAKNTLIVYASDQSFYIGEHGFYDKRWMYEESFSMPFVARWPDAIPAGSEVKELTQNIDFAPTFLEAAGAAVPGDMQGRSLLPLLQGRKPDDWRKSLYYAYYEFPQPHHVARHDGVFTARHKLMHFWEANEWELFDLEKDPKELRSVFDDPAYKTVREELTAELKRLREFYKAPSYEQMTAMAEGLNRRPAGAGAGARRAQGQGQGPKKTP